MQACLYCNNSTSLCAVVLCACDELRCFTVTSLCAQCHPLSPAQGLPELRIAMSLLHALQQRLAAGLLGALA
jgi:hypothetical protein